MRTNIERLFMHIANQSRIHTISAYPFFKGDGTCAEEIFDEMVKASKTPQTALLGNVKSPVFKAAKIWRSCIEQLDRDYTNAFDVTCELTRLPDGEVIADKIIKNVFNDNCVLVPMYFVHGPHCQLNTQEELDTFSNIVESVKLKDKQICTNIIMELGFDEFMIHLSGLGKEAEWVLSEVIGATPAWFKLTAKASMTSGVNGVRKLFELSKGIYLKEINPVPDVTESRDSLLEQLEADEKFDTPTEQKEPEMDQTAKNKEFRPWVINTERRFHLDNVQPGFAVNEEHRGTYINKMVRLADNVELLFHIYQFVKGNTHIDLDIPDLLTNPTKQKIFSYMLGLYASQNDLIRFGIPATTQYPINAVELISNTVTDIIKRNSPMFKQHVQNPLTLTVDEAVEIIKYIGDTDLDYLHKLVKEVQTKKNQHVAVLNAVTKVKNQVRDVSRHGVKTVMENVQNLIETFGHEAIIEALAEHEPEIVQQRVAVDTVNIHFLKEITTALEENQVAAKIIDGVVANAQPHVSNEVKLGCGNPNCSACSSELLADKPIGFVVLKW